MSMLVYRIPGNPSGLSMKYLAAMTALGWDETTINSFRTAIPLFESASLTQPFETALLMFTDPLDPGHLPFLERLYNYIRVLTQAERDEELHRKASNKESDSIEAANILRQIEAGVGPDPSQTGQTTNVIFQVKEPVNEVKVTRGTDPK